MHSAACACLGSAAACCQVGPSRVGVKLQPGLTFSELVQPEEEVAATLDYLAPALSARGLAYVCCSSLNGEPYFRVMGENPNAVE